MEIITKQHSSHTSSCLYWNRIRSHNRARGAANLEGREVDELSAGFQTREHMADEA